MGKVAAVGHIITLTVLAWGHTKCACGMVAKAVRFKPIYATVFVGLPFFERTKKEIDSHFISGEEDHLRNLIRVVGLKCDALPYETTTLNDEFLKLYKKLLASESIPEQPESDVHLPAIEPPRLFVLDFFLNNTLYAVRSISGKSVPIYTLQSGGSTGILFLFSPEHLGGNGDLEEKLKKITTEDEEQRKKETIEIYRRCYGEVVKIPGLPPMYDYEFSPQESIFGHEISAFSAPVHKFFNESDGVVLNTIPEFEEDAINAVQSWFGDDPVFSTGPFDFSLIERKEETSPGALEVRAFLDKALKDHGPHSVLYISFGSMFWFKDPSKLLPFFEVLLEKRRPFIFSIASPFAMFPDEMRERILNSGLAYISSWAPQIDILNHEATGWFMSHCGHNSTIESLSAGVPMICCPFDADQPANAANLSHTHDVAYELFELRTGHGLRPIHRLGDRQPEGTEESVRREILEILEKASGPDGQRKRENARRFKEAIKRSWAPDGSNWKEIERLVNIASEKELRN